MAVITTLADCSTNPASNGPDGTVDPPSFLDDAIRYALSFIAQLRDGAGTPVGMLTTFVGGTASAGWIKANGALVSRTTYAALFAYASAQGLVSEADWTATSSGRFSVGDGITTFRLPDTRGVFIRGLDESRGIDTGRAVGTYQDMANAAHNHGVNDPTHNHPDPGHAHQGATTSGTGDHDHGYTAPQVSGTGAGTAGPFSKLVDGDVNRNTSGTGGHVHAFTTDVRGVNLQPSATGISIQSQGSEARPRNMAYPMYLKY